MEDSPRFNRRGLFLCPGRPIGSVLERRHRAAKVIPAGTSQARREQIDDTASQRQPVSLLIPPFTLPREGMLRNVNQSR